MMKNFTKLPVVLILVLLFLVAGLYFYNYDPNAFEGSRTVFAPTNKSFEYPDDLRTCSSDSECVLVDTKKCYSCPTVINKKYLDYWNDISFSVDECDPGVSWPMCRPVEEVGCVNNLCSFNKIGRSS